MSKVGDSALEEVEVLRQRVIGFEPELQFLEELCPKIDQSFNPTVGVGYQTGQLFGALLALHVPEGKGISDIVPILREVRKFGQKFQGVEDYAEIERRSWKFGNIRVNAFFWKTGAKCSFVKVGVEEKPIYKLVCSEDDTTGLEDDLKGDEK